MSTEEKLNQAKGSIKEGVGKMIGDEKMEKEGTAEKVVSKVKEVAEDAKTLSKALLKVLKTCFTKMKNKAKR